MSGTNCIGLFENEEGRHCVQRIPPTENNGRRQTSIVVVGILPIQKEYLKETLKQSDLETVAQTGKQGAGGQNVNRVHSAIRMKHIPTGLSVFINGRDQLKNKREALEILTLKVNRQKQEKDQVNYNMIRKDKLGKAGRGDKIRTYHFCENRITDFRMNKKTSNIKAFMKGDFGVLFNN